MSHEFLLPGEQGAAIGGTLDAPRAASEEQPAPVPQPASFARHVGPGGKKGDVLDPKRHIPIALDTRAHMSDPSGSTPPDIVVMDGHAAALDIDQAHAKSWIFGNDLMLCLGIGFLMRIAVFFALVASGSRVYAGIYAVTFFLEALLFTLVSFRSKPGGRKLLWCAKVITWTFVMVTLPLAISASVTNWVHFEDGWARWVAVGLSYAHTLIYIYIGICLTNIIQSKMVLALRTRMFGANRALVHGADERGDKKKAR